MRHTRPASFVAFLTAITFAAAWAAAPASAQTPVQPLHATPAQAVGRTPASAFDGVVEAVRQTVIAAQVSGAVVQLDAKVGDRVQAGQLLLRLDARAADQNVAASDAQVQAARASLAVARKDFERQKQLHKNGYISQAALDLAESTFKSAQAEANALSAQAGASRTQTAYHVVSAPFAGVVSDVPVSLGDMAMPGRPLLSLYDPTALRVTASVPQSVAARSQDDAQVRIELPGVPAVASRVTPVRVLVLPTVDSATHSVEMRADLPSGLSGVSPGMFARLWLPIAPQNVDGAGPRATAVSVPVQAIVRRAELTAVYVLNPQGMPVLRQVRLGRTIDDSVEVLSGLMAGELVVDDRQAAARALGPAMINNKRSVDSKGEVLGISGRIAAYFQWAQITPLLALLAMLLGLFAVVVTPREEEPQINVTMANVLIPFPGAAVRDVEQMVAIPAEQVLSQIRDVEHVWSLSRPGLAVLTVQFEVGVTRTEAMVRLYDTVNSNADWLPKGLGVLEPIIKPKGIDDVPIVTLTLFSENPATGAFDLERVAHSIESDLKRVPGTREVTTTGGPGRAVMVEIDPVRMAGVGVTVTDLRQALVSANLGMPVGELIAGNRSVVIESGPFLRDAEEVASLVVGVRAGKPIFLRDVAAVRDGPLPPSRYVWHGVADHDGDGSSTFPAVTITVTKKAGENAIDVAEAVMQRVDLLRNTVIPGDVRVAETRNYGATANDKAQTLIKKLLFATLSVVALVFFALGRREAAIIGSAVVLTLTATLFLSWAWGFTLNRVSLFALIFSIGILVDDAIVVVENIHRHQHLYPGRALGEIIPGAVDEVGGPTILATLTVIAALLPMAFVTGLMGPYMSPIPINASMGMLLSLAIAFVVTPWLARLWMKPIPVQADADGGPASKSQGGVTARIAPVFEYVFRPLLDERRGTRNRGLLGLGVLLLIVGSLALPATGLVLLKMLPFDNKSEFQVVVDMPEGAPLEQTAAVLRELGDHLLTVPEVTDYQAYAGTAAPINFNGLVRQYYLRSGGNVGDLQVNLADKSARKDQSHAIAMRVRPELQRIGARLGANVKVVEVPPGPPVLSPIVAEIYGPEEAGRKQVAKAVRAVFERTAGVVDVDDSSTEPARKTMLLVDRQKAAMLGVSQQAIVSTLRAGLAGEATAFLHDETKYPAAAILQLPPEQHGDLDALLQLAVRSASGALVPISELVTLSDRVNEQPIHHKDLLPMNFVVADMAGKLDSPLYGMFRMRSELAAIATPGGGTLQEYFISQPADAYRDYSLKWDGEWQITYETFRDMGLAYGVGLILIYLLVVAHFGSYLTPLIIMAPIPLTIIGVMPGHALLGAQYTATSMIGMIALAGIIVRNSILLVDFINLQVRDGVEFRQAIVRSAITRAQPILLTGLAAMLGAFFILDDPIFNGLAISMIFGVFVSTVLTLVVIPILYYMAYRRRLGALTGREESESAANPPSDTALAQQ